MATLFLCAVLAAGLAAPVWRFVNLDESPTPVPSDVAVVSIWGAALLVAIRISRADAPLRRIAVVPTVTQSLGRRTLERSHFGVGSLRGWTVTAPSSDLGRAVRVCSIETGPLPDIEAATQVVKVPTRGAGLDEGALNGAADLSSGSAGPGLRQPVGSAQGMGGGMATRRCEVQRGDTFWTLAEQLLGDGGQWATIRDLNVGETVAADTVMSPDDSLRVGWSIHVPLEPTTDGGQR